MSLLLYPEHIGSTPPPTPIFSTTHPIISMFYSDNGGMTWKATADRVLGQQGHYTGRLIWTNLGASRYRVYRFQISDPTPTWTTDLTTEVKGGKF